MDHIYLGEFAYPGVNRNYPGRCGLSIWRASHKHYAVVIASELPTNPGASITNAYEHLATRVVHAMHPKSRRGAPCGLSIIRLASACATPITMISSRSGW